MLFGQCIKIENIDKFILATSYLREDDELAKIKHKKFEVFKGEPENLVKDIMMRRKKID